MAKGIIFSDKFIENRIRYYKHGVLIEVTNGIINGDRRQHKKKQVREGKNILRLAFGDEVHIRGGIALLKNTQKKIKELDFGMEIGNYVPSLLGKVVGDLLHSKSVEEADKKYILTLMGGFKSLRSHLNPSPSTRRHLSKNYIDRISHIKGLVLENYVAALFQEVLPVDFYDISIRGKIVNERVNPTQTFYPDLIIATPPKMFEKALEELVEKYSGRQRISVKYTKS